MSETPSHYRGDGAITCADALRSMTADCRLPPMESYWWGCALKYVWRWPHKGGAEDIEKAIDCLQKLLAEKHDDGYGHEMPPEAKELYNKLANKLKEEK